MVCSKLTGKEMGANCWVSGQCVRYTLASLPRKGCRQGQKKRGRGGGARQLLPVGGRALHCCAWDATQTAKFRLGVRRWALQNCSSPGAAGVPVLGEVCACVGPRGKGCCLGLVCVGVCSHGRLTGWQATPPCLCLQRQQAGEGRLRQCSASKQSKQGKRGGSSVCLRIKESKARNQEKTCVVRGARV